MKHDTASMIAAIDAAAKRWGVAVSTASQLAARDRFFRDRLAKGGRFWPETAEKVMQRIEEQDRKRGVEA